jgi:hypothetical protein
LNVPPELASLVAGVINVRAWYVAGEEFPIEYRFLY